MRKASLLLSAFSIFIFSCQKEISLDIPGTTTGTGGTGGTVSNKLLGTWKFVHLRAVTFASNQSIIGSITQRTETTSDYTTINNAGTVVFTAQNLSNNNVAYAVDSYSFNKLYENGVLIDTFTMPLQSTIPPVSNSATYTAVGADSITMVSGTTTSGAKLRFSNDTLYMSQKVNESGLQNVGGVVINTTRIADLTTVLKKQ